MRYDYVHLTPIFLTPIFWPLAALWVIGCGGEQAGVNEQSSLLAQEQQHQVVGDSTHTKEDQIELMSEYYTEDIEPKEEVTPEPKKEVTLEPKEEVEYVKIGFRFNYVGKDWRNYPQHKLDAMEARGEKVAQAVAFKGREISYAELKEMVKHHNIVDKITYVSDEEKYGINDDWRTLSKENNFEGDCEDWAFYYMQMLLDAGVHPKYIRLTIGDAELSDDILSSHAWVEVESTEGVMVINYGSVYVTGEDYRNGKWGVHPLAVWGWESKKQEVTKKQKE